MAAPVTPGEALQRVAEAQGPTEVRRVAAAGQTVLAFTLNQPSAEAGKAALYMFNTPGGGFILAPADDRLPAVLGYGDSAVSTPEQLSPTQKWWFEGYADMVKAVADGSGQLDESGATRASWAAIAPLVKTTWNQDAPFNNDCPSVNWRRTYSGCVATAMAQIINYWQSPARGQGTHSYEWEGGETISFDYEATPFDYANMIDNYQRGKYTTAQGSAVAALMKACGVAIDMNYGVDGSGAKDYSVLAALTDYFYYDKSTLRFQRRQTISTAKWEEMIYNDLAEKHPILYCGQANGGGHAFVCDGYDGNGMFHINWGWGGYQDGYFTLLDLNPEGGGIGGFDGGYNRFQSINIGIKPLPGHSGIESVSDGASAEGEILAIYTADGVDTGVRSIASLESGLYIVRSSEGSRKVLIP